MTEEYQYLVEMDGEYHTAKSVEMNVDERPTFKDNDVVVDQGHITVEIEGMRRVHTDGGQDDMDRMMDEIQRENDLRFAYIAGVKKGFELVEEYEEKPDRETFHNEVRSSFQEWLEE